MVFPHIQWYSIRHTPHHQSICPVHHYICQLSGPKDQMMKGLIELSNSMLGLSIINSLCMWYWLSIFIDTTDIIYIILLLASVMSVTLQVRLLRHTCRQLVIQVYRPYSSHSCRHHRQILHAVTAMLLQLLCHRLPMMLVIRCHRSKCDGRNLTILRLWLL